MAATTTTSPFFDTDQLEAVQAKFLDGLAFLWFHYARVLDGLAP